MKEKKLKLKNTVGYMFTGRLRVRCLQKYNGLHVYSLLWAGYVTVVSWLYVCSSKMWITCLQK